MLGHTSANQYVKRLGPRGVHNNVSFDQVDAYNNPIPWSLDFTRGEPQGTFSWLQVIFVWILGRRYKKTARTFITIFSLSWTSKSPMRRFTSHYVLVTSIIHFMRVRQWCPWRYCSSIVWDSRSLHTAGLFTAVRWLQSIQVSSLRKLDVSLCANSKI